MAFMTSRKGHSRGRPRARGLGMKGSSRAHSASVKSVSYRNPSRLCCRRVAGVHIAVPEKASTTPRNHARPGHSTLSGRALRKRPTIARDQFLKPLPTVAVQGLVVADPLGEQKPLDAIDVPDPFGCQGLALTTDPAPILLLWARSLDHRTNPGLAPLVGQQGSHQSLTVDPVGLRPPTPTGRGDRGGIDDMALDPFA